MTVAAFETSSVGQCHQLGRDVADAGAADNLVAQSIGDDGMQAVRRHTVIPAAESPRAFGKPDLVIGPRAFQKRREPVELRRGYVRRVKAPGMIPAQSRFLFQQDIRRAGASRFMR